MRVMPTRDEVANLRERFPKGSRVKLIEMLEDPNPLMPGDVGTVTFQ